MNDKKRKIITEAMDLLESMENRMTNEEFDKYLELIDLQAEIEFVDLDFIEQFKEVQAIKKRNESQNQTMGRYGERIWSR